MAMDDFYNAPGAAAGDAMQSFMMQQQALKHQQLLDSLASQRGQLEQQREARLGQHDNLDLEMKRLMLEEKKQALAEQVKEKARQDHIKVLGTMVPGDVPDAKTIADSQEFGTEHLLPDPKQGLRDFAKTLPAGSPEAAGIQQQLGGPIRVFAGLPAQRADAERQQKIKALMDRLPTAEPGTPEFNRLALEYEMTTGKQIPAAMLKPAPPPKPETKPIYGLGKSGKIEQLGEMPANGVLRTEPAPPAAPAGHYMLQPEIDPDTGKQTGRYLGYNTKTNAWEPVQGQGPAGTKAAPGAAQMVMKGKERADARSVLDHLDKDIDTADSKGLLGPGSGRISDLEQLIGNADPATSTLATRMFVAKMKVDAAIGGMRAAASPQLLQRWNNLMGSKMNKENLHAVAQVMRDLVGEEKSTAGSGSSSSAAKPSAIDLIKKYSSQP